MTSTATTAAASAAEPDSPEPAAPPTKKARMSEDDSAEETAKSANSGPGTKKEGGDGDSSSSSALAGVISPSVLESESSLSKSYASTAEPYPHGVVRPLCVPAFLSAVLEEVKLNSKVRFKESDLFRVYQSIDLANLVPGSDEALKMPSLMKLRDALYSAEFRELVERITGLEKGTLTERVDCAANCHAKGCHLLCHDDVIGTRKVSYIIYLTDPEPEWTEEDGGRLELYGSKPEEGEGKKGGGGEGDAGSRRVPDPFPSATLLPHFNSFAFFAVTPGRSFHSVQEVFCDRPRLSLQGWYHAQAPPDGMEDATLSRLKSRAGEDTEGGFEAFPAKEEEKSAEEKGEPAPAAATEKKDDEPPPSLSDSDLAHLSKFINPTYLTAKSLAEIRSKFEEESSVQLRHFLTDEWASRLSAATGAEDKRDGLGRGRPSLDYEVGVEGGWSAVGPAHKQRFLEYTGKADEDAPQDKKSDGDKAAGPLLHALRRDLLRSSPFARFLSLLTSLSPPAGHRGRVRRFRPGLDYTVAHYGVLTQRSVLDATVCFCAGKGEQPKYDEEVGDLLGDDDDAIWETGDAGGFECYISAEDEDARDSKGKSNAEAADEYDEEDDTELLSVSASHNTLSLVLRDPGTMRFVKYVGSSAPGSRWDVGMEYEVLEEDEGGNDGDGMDEDKKDEKGGDAAATEEKTKGDEAEDAAKE